METTNIQYMFQEWLLFAWDFAQKILRWTKKRNGMHGIKICEPIL